MFLDDDVHRRLCLCDDRLVIRARKRDDEVTVLFRLLQSTDIVDVPCLGAAQTEARTLLQYVSHNDLLCSNHFL